MFIRGGLHQFAGLSVQLFVGDVEFLEVNGDEVSEIGGSVNRVVHCGNRLHPAGEKVNGNFELFLTIR